MIVLPADAAELLARITAAPGLPGAGVLHLPAELLHDHDETTGDELARELAAALTRPLEDS